MQTFDRTQTVWEFHCNDFTAVFYIESDGNRLMFIINDVLF